MNPPPARALAFALFLTAGTVTAQDGVVRASGQPIPGASVTATLSEQKLTTITDEGGRYHFDKLSPGEWNLSVDIFGFGTQHKKVNVELAGVPIEWDLALELHPRPPAPAAPRVPVQGRFQGGFQNLTLTQNQAAEEQPAALPDPAAVGATGNANEAFLVNGTLSQGLAQARQEDTLNPAGDAGAFGRGPGEPGGPGSQGLPGFGGGAFGGGAAGGVPAGGGGGRGFGGGGGFGGGRGPGGRGPRSGFPASFGNRAGRNRGAFRGQMFFNLGNSVLNARPYSLTGEEQLKPSYGSARFGLNAGGALNIPHLIHSPRTFFFLNITGVLSRQPYSQFSTLPTELERGGNFSQSSFDGRPVAIFDPLTNIPFPNNQIPASRLNQVALNLLPYIPHANLLGQVQNYQIIESYPNNNGNLNLRISRPLTKKDSIDFNINMQKRTSHSVQLFGYSDEASGFGLSTTLGWTRNLGRASINNLRFTFSRNRSALLPAFAYGPDVAALVGINGTSTDPINFGPPNLSFTNYGGLTDGTASLTRNQTAGISDGVTLVRGHHNITFGGEFRRQQLNLESDQNGRGTYSFSGLATSAFDAQGQPIVHTGYDFADFLLGLPQSSNIRFGEASNYFRASVYDAYVQDDWRVKPKLTILAGLRYEYFTPYSEKYGHIANLDIAPGFTAVAVVTPGQAGPYSGQFPPGLVNSDPKEFAPRVGIALRPWNGHQTLIRAGYGIFFNGSIYSQFPSRLATQPPFATTANLVTSVDQPLTIANGFATVPSQPVTNTYAVALNYRVGYAQTWNFSIQKPLRHSLVMELGYLGTKGTRLDIQEYPSSAPPGSFLNSQQRVQTANASGFILDTSNGNSTYEAFQARITRRFSKGIAANALYTFSKSIDDASTIGGGTAVVAQNFNDLSAERGLSSFDKRHNLNLNYILTSPVGENGLLRGGKAQKLLGDWTLSGGLTVSSGLPFTARVLGNQANIAGAGSVGSGRAQATGLPIDLTPNGAYFNLLAFTVPVPGTFGNAARNTIPGPGFVSINLSIGRSFKLRDERKRIEFRLDSSNTLNHVNITSLYTVVNASNYGLAAGAGQMRTVSATVRLRF